MKCPCKGCSRAGCGEYQEKCEAYKKWKKNLDEAKEWLRGQMPITSEAGLKQRARNMKTGKSRKWNLKQRYRGGNNE